MEKKKNISGIILVVILFLAVIGLMGYILIDKNIIKLKKSDKETELKEKKESISEEKVKELLDKFYLYNKKEDYESSYIFKQQEIYNKGYNNISKFHAAWDNLLASDIEDKSCSELYSSDKFDEFGNYQKGNGVCPKESFVKTVSYEKLNQIYINMFGSNAPKKNVFNSKTEQNHFDYLEDKDIFVELLRSSGDVIGSVVTIDKVKSYKIEGAQLIIDLYYSYIEPSDYDIKNNKFTYKLGEKNITESNIDIARKEIEENYMDEIDVYQATFEKEGYNYIFKSLEKK